MESTTPELIPSSTSLDSECVGEARVSTPLTFAVVSLLIYGSGLLIPTGSNKGWIQVAKDRGFLFRGCGCGLVSMAGEEWFGHYLGQLRWRARRLKPFGNNGGDDSESSGPVTPTENEEAIESGDTLILNSLFGHGSPRPLQLLGKSLRCWIKARCWRVFNMSKDCYCFEAMGLEEKDNG
uniref:Uncharacterized protein n=1 Tax=Tanacetum cinerariifolium TaxID=118510 RepID=A0A6L2JNE4_TANCI|nr:hypothetical protein [Tanacetum cinerariifolium]